MIKDDGTVIHFNNPKVQASLAANTFAVTGHAENKQITEMLPGILNQLGAESLTHLKRLASNVPVEQVLEMSPEVMKTMMKSPILWRILTKPARTRKQPRMAKFQKKRRLRLKKSRSERLFIESNP